MSFQLINQHHPEPFITEFENNLIEENEDTKKLKEEEEQAKRERTEKIRVTYEKKGARVTGLPDMGVLTLEEMKELVREVFGVQYRKSLYEFSVVSCKLKHRRAFL